MPSTRRRAKAVASPATAGAIMICEAVAAVLSQAPSSKLKPSAPLRSGRLIVNKRLSKFAKKAPSKTAPTANSGRCDIAPVETGPLWITSFCAIGAVPAHSSRRFIDANSGHRRHTRQEPLKQRLALVERNPHRDALDHLGKVAGGVVGRKQGKLRSACRRNALDLAAQRLVRKSIDGDLNRLTRLHPRELCLLVIGDHVDVWQRHDVDSAGSDNDVISLLPLPLAYDAIKRRNDFGIAEPQFGRSKRGLRASRFAGRWFFGPASTSNW